MLYVALVAIEMIDVIDLIGTHRVKKLLVHAPSRDCLPISLRDAGA